MVVVARVVVVVVVAGTTVVGVMVVACTKVFGVTGAGDGGGESVNLIWEGGAAESFTLEKTPASLDVRKSSIAGSSVIRKLVSLVSTKG